MSEKKEEYDPKRFKVDELIFPKGDSWKYAKEFGQNIRACDEVRATNGIIFTKKDYKSPENKRKSNYRYAYPTRGNCSVCGQSGPLGHLCMHGCVLGIETAPTSVGVHKKNRHLLTQKTKDYNKKIKVKYMVMTTPYNHHHIDATFFANLMYKGPDDDPSAPWVPHVDVKIDLPKLKNPEFYVKSLDTDDQWYDQLNGLCTSLDYGTIEDINENAVYTA